MLTRHLYELDEVCLNLCHCLRFGDAKKAVFWARELLLSNEENTFEKTMILAWIMYLGAPRIHWLDAWTTVGSDVGGCERLVLVVEFCKLREIVMKKPYPAMLKCFVIAGRGAAIEANQEKLNRAIETNNPFGVYWNIASGKKPNEIVDSLCELVDSPEIFTSLRHAMNGCSIHVRTLLSVVAVQVFCLNEFPASLEISSKKDVAQWLAEWEPHIGRRKGRLYEIDCKGLPQAGKRKTQKDAFISVSATELMEDGCAFWKTELSLIQDDDTLEYIVTKHFPDDIPDEWSYEERSKSHPVEAGGGRLMIKPEYQLSIVYKFSPALRKEWAKKLRDILKTIGFPDQ